MFSFILSLLPQLWNPKILKLAGAILVVVFFFIWINWSLNAKEEIGVLTQTIKDQTAEIKRVEKTAEAEVATYKAVITQQHATLKSLQEQGKENETQMKTLQQTLIKNQQQYNQHITNILKQPRPVDCRSSIDYLKANAGEIKW